MPNTDLHSHLSNILYLVKLTLLLNVLRLKLKYFLPTKDLLGPPPGSWPLIYVCIHLQPQHLTSDSKCFPLSCSSSSSSSFTSSRPRASVLVLSLHRPPLSCVLLLLKTRSDLLLHSRASSGRQWQGKGAEHVQRGVCAHEYLHTHVCVGVFLLISSIFVCYPCVFASVFVCFLFNNVNFLLIYYVHLLLQVCVCVCVSRFMMQEAATMSL